MKMKKCHKILQGYVDYVDLEYKTSVQLQHHMLLVRAIIFTRDNEWVPFLLQMVTHNCRFVDCFFFNFCAIIGPCGTDSGLEDVYVKAVFSDGAILQL